MSVSYALPAEIGLDADQLTTAYALLARWTSGPGAPLPGAAILVGRHGRVCEPRFFGKQGPDEGAEPIRRDAIFLLASLTKPLTYLAGLMLVERGLLNLGEPVVHYLPEFAAHDKRAVEVRHLFTHTSGLPDMLNNNLELRRRGAPLNEFIRGAMQDTQLLFPPGTAVSYQSMGTLVVAELVQRLSGKRIGDFLRDEIAQPLGWKATALGARGLDARRIVRLATPTEQEPSWNWNSQYWRELGAPWGGLFSTPEEYAALCQLMLNGGALGDVRLIASATARRMTTNRLDDFPDLAESFRRTQPWGLGWQMNQPASGQTFCELLGTQAYGHWGATGTMCWLDPASGTFCLVFTSAPLDNGKRRLVSVSNAVAAAIR
jgi:CubicO group peptidase (beta-lactamase class C family)